MVPGVSSVVRVAVLAAGLSTALLTTGCFGGGGGGGFFAGFFGGGDSSDILGGLSDTGSGSGAGPGDPFPDAATVRNPEPASLALFGSGLAGTALLRRRRKARASRQS